MAEPIAAWHADHVNFARLLNLLERQLIAFHAGEEPDYPVMLASVYYLRHYPDRVHHPREDVAFARLVARDPALQLPIARRLQEHRVIAAAGEELLKLLQGVVEGVLVERSAIETAAATYLEYYPPPPWRRGAGGHPARGAALDTGRLGGCRRRARRFRPAFWARVRLPLSRAAQTDRARGARPGYRVMPALLASTFAPRPT